MKNNYFYVVGVRENSRGFLTREGNGYLLDDFSSIAYQSMFKKAVRFRSPERAFTVARQFMRKYPNNDELILYRVDIINDDYFGTKFSKSFVSTIRKESEERLFGSFPEGVFLWSPSRDMGVIKTHPQESEVYAIGLLAGLLGLDTKMVTNYAGYFNRIAYSYTGIIPFYGACKVIYKKDTSSDIKELDCISFFYHADRTANVLKNEPRYLKGAIALKTDDAALNAAEMAMRERNWCPYAHTL